MLPTHPPKSPLGTHAHRDTAKRIFLDLFSNRKNSHRPDIFIFISKINYSFLLARGAGAEGGLSIDALGVETKTPFLGLTGRRLTFDHFTFNSEMHVVFSIETNSNLPLHEYFAELDQP